MEPFEPLIAALLLMPLFAAVGVTTVAAFALMGVFGLVTEWSFKRVFFTSFALGLLAPIIVAAAIGNSVEEALDGRDVREVIAQNIPGAEQQMQQWEEAGQRMQEIGEAAERGEITEDEAREQIRQIINERTGLQINLDDVQIDVDDLRAEIEDTRTEIEENRAVIVND